MPRAKLSLIIPTYNRTRFALRNMRFWSGREVAVYVLDGSATPIGGEDLSGLAPNVHYHHLPAPLPTRLEYGTAMAETDYLAMLGDDEFFVESALDACVAELDADPALVSCMGRALRFQVVDRAVLAQPAYPELADYSVPQESGAERMAYHMYPYRPSSFYSVMRRSVWRKIAGLLAARTFDHFAIAEMQVELAAAYCGKAKVIRHLMWLRSSENIPLWSTGGHRTFPEWWEDSSKHLQRRELIRLTARHLVLGSQDSAPDVEAALEHAIDRFAEGYWAVRAKPASVRRVRRALQRSSALLPASVKAAVKKAVAKSGRLSQLSDPPPTPIQAAVAELRAAGVVIDSAQLAAIERSILSFSADTAR